MSFDPQKLEAFIGRVLQDAGAAASAVLVRIGDRLGLYRELHAGGPQTPAELAARTHTAERYVREWLNSQAAGGYVTFDAATERFFLDPEQALALAIEGSPAFVPGLFDVVAAMAAGTDRVEDCFRTGAGIPWGDQHPCLFAGTERFFRPGYVANLVTSWLPALDGVVGKLEAGASVADLGCGFGASTIVMASAYPNSRFVGYDTHRPSIEAARGRAREAGVADRVSFEVASATDYPGADYDLVAVFDALHDLEDPAGAAAHTRRALAPDGTFLVVEPMAGDRPQDNHHVVGRLFYSASTCICVPHSLSRGGPALGAQAGEGRLRAILEQAGFQRFRRAAETPFNLVLEARP